MKSQECFGFKIQDLCSNNIKCSIFECQKLHPRCLAGVCIQFLNGSCKENNCVLLHLKVKDRNTEQNIPPILGVQRFNFCRKQNLCKDKECRYIHKFWAEKYCIYCLNDEDCEETQTSLVLNTNVIHQDLKTFRESVYKQHSIQNTNPEQLCPNKGICENCTKIHPQFLQDICVKYLQGVCPFLRSCTHKHIDWESLHNHVKQDDSNILQACSKKSWLKNQNQSVVRNLQEKFKIYTTKQQHKQLMDMQAKIQKFYQVDLIIVMDCTGSMALWMQKAQETVLSLIDKFEGFLKSYFYRIGFVGYRDYGDKEKHIVFHDLSDQIKSVQNFICSQKAEGGGDDAEDIVGALNQAKKLNISKHEDSILITILVADQPCHGKQYHSDKVSDDHKDKVPNGTLENLMKSYYKLKKNNYFTCITINETTTQMNKIMQNNFPGLVITQISKPDQFENICEYTLSTSIQNTVIFNDSQDEEIFVKASWAMPNIQMPLPIQLPCEEENIWNKFLQQVRENSTTGKTTLRINKKMMNQDMIAEGTNSYVFRVFDTFHNKYMIAKIGKDLVDQKVINQSVDLKKQKGEEDFDLNEELKKDCFRRYNQSAFANQVARSYRKKLIDANIPAMPLFYVLPICYELETPFMNSKFLFAEPFIDIDEDWVKFTNNLNFVKKNSEPLTSFSHFTFQATENELIITDLQGKKNILSDPAIQTVGKFDTDMLKDKANLGMQGILAFIKEQHKFCFSLCKQLELSRSNFPNADIITLDSDEDEGIDVAPIKQTEKIYLICQICQSIQKSTYQQYAENYKRNQEQCLCADCETRCKSEQRSICVCCEREFRFNYFIEMVQFGHFPQVCQDCKTQCAKENIEKCQYCDRKCQMNSQRKYIGVKSYIFCKFSKEYLNSMSCQKCSTDYSYDILLDKNQYENKKYICLKCQ